jgi:hypothetical protein
MQDKLASCIILQRFLNILNEEKEQDLEKEDE